MEQKKKNYSEIFLNLYNAANSEIELLKEYYTMSYKSLEDKKNLIESKYKIGEQISSLLDKIVDKKSFEIKEDVLQESNNIILFDKVKFSDVIKNLSVDKDKKRILFSIDEKYKKHDELNPNIASKKFNEIKQFETILSRSILSDLIVLFESTLGKLLNVLSVSNPFSYLENEMIPLAKFFLDGFTKELFNKIDLSVEKKMYDSLKALNEIIEIEKIEIEKSVLTSFKEIYFRRNVAVHNDCKANKKYLDSVDLKSRKGIKDGDKLICDNNYFNNAFIVITKLFFFIFYGILQKHSDDTNFINKIGLFAFKKLQDKDYEIAQIIYKTISINKKLEFIDKMMYRINYLNAIKQLGEIETLNKELATLDVSIATDNFKIAKLCLQNNDSEIYHQLSKTYPNSFGAIEIKEWPLFINFRESEEYTLFCKEHADDFLNEEFIDDSSKNN